MLKIFDIDSIKEGMFVDAIEKQQGKVNITSRGRITSVAVIKQLKKKGVLSVMVDLSKQLKPEFDQPEKSSQKELAQKELKGEVPTQQPKDISFEKELEVATELHLEGKNLQKIMLDSVGKNLPIDVTIAQAFTNSLVSSIGRNPNALMFMTKIREKDSYLLEHSLNVAILLANFGIHIGLDEEQIQELVLSGFLHDIGKIKIRDEILHKPGHLSDQEMNHMKDHVYYGIKLLIGMGIPDSIVKTIGQHHERIDGYGYPKGLRGDEISQYGRMIAIVDTYDAITADRCYKLGMPSKKALQILLQDAPEKYDEVLVTQFVQCIGIFPAGSLVKLNNNRVAMVLKHNPLHTTKPVVKVFYSIQDNAYLEPKEFDLADASNDIKIVEAVVASDFNLDFNQYFNESIAVSFASL